MDGSGRSTIKLKPADILIWDIKEHTVAFFVEMFQHTVELEGDEPVLRILPLCLKGDALE